MSHFVYLSHIPLFYASHMFVCCLVSFGDVWFNFGKVREGIETLRSHFESLSCKDWPRFDDLRVPIGSVGNFGLARMFEFEFGGS